jgi:CDP-6-deoxy-D-xylo-4-hexulose-3-dehydrase
VHREDLTNIDIVISRMFWASTYPSVTRPLLDFLADSIRECLAETAR